MRVGEGQEDATVLAAPHLEGAPAIDIDTTMSPGCGVSDRSTTARSPLNRPLPTMLSPATRKRKVTGPIADQQALEIDGLLDEVVDRARNAC